MSDDALRIDARLAQDDFMLNVAAGLPLNGATAIVGPSGAGKTSLLRLIAGLSRPDHGRIIFKGETWCDTHAGAFVPAHKRHVGVVFQDGRLFPHLTVEKNLLYADKRSTNPDSRYAIDDVVGALDLHELLQRRPQTLSGGERQRVALARALLSRPELLLLDEPLSALDRARKTEILPYLVDLPKRFGAPMLYVSHNLDEVIRIADEVAVMAAGKIAAVGPLAATLNAHGALIGEDDAVIVEGRVEELSKSLHLARINIGAGVVALPAQEALSTGAKVRLRIHAKDVAISLSAPEGLSIRNALKAAITDIRPGADPAFLDVKLAIGGAPLIATITRAAAEDLSLREGQEVYALVKSASMQ
ncbi:MAG: molybdenum ABC transporter ATP-binding protein [Pseudomonadota bacterium]